LRRLKELETENARLKRMYADLSLTHHALEELVAKKSRAARSVQRDADQQGTAAFSVEGIGLTDDCVLVPADERLPASLDPRRLHDPVTFTPQAAACKSAELTIAQG